MTQLGTPAAQVVQCSPQTGEVCPLPPIPAILGRCEKAIFRLHESIEGLGVRLKPYLASEPADAPSCVQKMVAEVSPAADRLAILERRIEEAILSMADLTARLDL